MHTHLKELTKQTLVYGLGGILNQLVGFLLIPVYTRYLLPEDYGVVQILLVTSAFVVIVARLGLSSAILKSALYDQIERSEVVYSTAFFLLLGSALLAFGLGGLASRMVSVWLFDSVAYRHLVFLVFAGAALDTAAVIPLAHLRVKGDAVKYSLVNTSSFLCRLLLNILFVVNLARGAMGLIEANVLQSMIFLFVYIWLIRDQLGWQFSAAKAVDLLAFGLPLVPAMMASRILALSSRYILNYYGTLNQVGLYSLGYKISSIVSIAASAFQTAWPAILFASGKREGSSVLYARTMTYYVFFSLYLSLGLSVLAEDVIRLLGTPAYYEAYRVVPLLALSYVFYGMYFVASGGVQLAKRTHYLAYVAGGAALLQIALNFWLIPRFDMLGAAWAAALSYLVMPFWIGWISQQFHPVTYDLARIGKLFVVAATLYGLSRVYRVANPFLSVVVRSLFALSYPLVSYGIGFFTEEEKNASKQLLGRFWRMLRGWQKP